jgi:hypothetical protein
VEKRVQLSAMISDSGINSNKNFNVLERNRLKSEQVKTLFEGIIGTHRYR